MFGLILMAFGKRRAQRPKGQTDEDLMERFRDQGDTAAFEELLRRHERPVFNFIRRMVRDDELANDLLQETFLRVVKSAKVYSRKAKFTTWLYTIARNQSIDSLRKAKHRRTVSLDAPVKGGEEGDRTLMERIPGKSEDAHTRLDAREMTERIQTAVNQLSDEQREVFMMRQFQGLPFKEIASVVGVSENTIKSRMRYALENLRLALADYAESMPGQVNPIPARSRV
ncbi:MAG: RNA polymerase sigma factor [Bradymonadia bacterium]